MITLNRDLSRTFDGGAGRADGLRRFLRLALCFDDLFHHPAGDDYLFNVDKVCKLLAGLAFRSFMKDERPGGLVAIFRLDPNGLALDGAGDVGPVDEVELPQETAEGILLAGVDFFRFAHGFPSPFEFHPLLDENGGDAQDRQRGDAAPAFFPRHPDYPGLIAGGEYPAGQLCSVGQFDHSG